MAIAPDGNTAISASSDYTLKIWDLLGGKEIASFSGDSGFDCCAISPDGVTVVAGDASGRCISCDWRELATGDNPRNRVFVLICGL